MKVIKNNYSDRSIQITCRQCKSILEINRADIRYDYDKDPYFKCPLCKKGTYVKYNEYQKLF